DVFLHGGGFHSEDYSYFFVRLRPTKPGQHQQFAPVEQSFLDDVLFQNDAHRALAVAIDLETALGNLGNYVNIIADGDPAILVQSGFLSYGTDHTPDTTPPGAP